MILIIEIVGGFLILSSMVVAVWGVRKKSLHDSDAQILAARMAKLLADMDNIVTTGTHTRPGCGGQNA